MLIQIATFGEPPPEFLLIVYMPKIKNLVSEGKINLGNLHINNIFILFKQYIINC